jgi:hypothetical protein
MWRGVVCGGSLCSLPNNFDSQRACSDLRIKAEFEFCTLIPTGIQKTLPRHTIPPLSVGLGDKVFLDPRVDRRAEHMLRLAAKIGAGFIACLNTIGKRQTLRLFLPHSTQPQTTSSHEFCTPIPTGS